MSCHIRKVGDLLSGGEARAPIEGAEVLGEEAATCHAGNDDTHEVWEWPGNGRDMAEI